MVATLSCRDELLTLRPGVYLAAAEERMVLYRRSSWQRAQAFGPPTAAKRAALRKLAERPCSAAELRSGADAPDGGFDAFLQDLELGGWLVRTVRHEGRDMYSVQPVGSNRARPAHRPADLTLSRFAVLRREGTELVVESPLATARVVIHDPACAVVVAELVTGGADGLTVASAMRAALLDDMSRTGLAEPRAADDDADLRLWSPSDLWFHQRSRSGNGGYGGIGFGRTGWAEPFLERATSEAPRAESGTALARPDLEALRASDPSLTAVLEDRRSLREHNDAAPLTVEQLGELLFRCAAARTRIHEGREHVRRPYPAGGAAYELEIYPVVRHVTGLAPGMYRYDPHTHRVDLVRGPGPAVERLLRNAQGSAAMASRPQVLLVVAAKFGRLTATYEELAYALVLKHVGVLHQTMYLVATAMGLAACALGAGDPAAFTAASGLPYPAQSSVGEFILGGRSAHDDGRR